MAHFLKPHHNYNPAVISMTLYAYLVFCDTVSPDMLKNRFVDYVPQATGETIAAQPFKQATA